ncbi:hypothetical protein EJ02DRAFT_516509 [Clathrospora elynae]|uniref:Glycine zipper 2TM domain-containing protein n=1 Tax=Clathrospora elynae TaxID=706981 RepID=A0A6A5S7E9_9PLEO|nr:hypothetical protein EJ02DRAFT_516509 [Clathrospora elynae]
MEEFVELGFEGLDKATDKYHDRVYDHMPAVPRPGSKKEQQQQQRDQHRENQENEQYPRDQYNQRDQDSRYSSQHPDKGYSHHRSGPPTNGNYYEDDPEMYAPDGQREYESRYGDDRYDDEEHGEYRAPGPGMQVSRGRDEYNNTRSLQVAPYQEPQRGYDSGNRGRPAPERRGSSWSPPRSERHDRKERDSRRPRSRSRSQSRSKDKQHRMLAMVGGAIVGGLAGNQAGKGKKYDTVATIVGAIAGGVGAKEVSEFWDGRQKKKERREEEWENEYGDDERKSNRRRSDSRGRDDRYDRDDRRRY